MKIRSLSKIFRILASLSVFIAFLQKPLSFTYKLGFLLNAPLFFIAVILTFKEYDGIFKNPVFFRLYFIFGVQLLSILLIFIIMFLLLNVFHVSSPFFLNFTWFLVAIFQVCLAIFLCYHIFLKLKSNELKKKYTPPKYFKLALIFCALAIGFFVWISIALKSIDGDPFLDLIASGLFWTSILGSLLAWDRFFCFFGSFRE